MDRVDNWNLQKLRFDTNEVLKKAFEVRDTLQDAINWGDLRCISAESYRDADEERGLRVIVSEAAPGCNALAAFVSSELGKLGWPDVQVQTEW